jgi:hypothetical protein
LFFFLFSPSNFFFSFRFVVVVVINGTSSRRAASLCCVRVALFGIFTFFSFPGLLLFSESDSLFFLFFVYFCYVYQIYSQFDIVVKERRATRCPFEFFLERKRIKHE